MLFGSIFTSPVTVGQFFIATGCSMLTGFVVAFFYLFQNDRPTRSMASSLVLLPGIVTVAIMLVNGNIGAGLAVAGVFNLVRFRSIQASAKELSCIFAAMVVGLCCGIGYVAIGFLFALLLAVMGAVLQATHFGEVRGTRRVLKITVPESLNYEEMFDDILEEYTSYHKELGVKTTAMGSLFRLKYAVEMRNGKSTKEMIDKIRERNGNLEISLSTSLGEEDGL